MSPTLVHPRTGKSISVSVALALRACVRASERAKLRAEMIPLWLGSGGEICGYPSLPPSVPPSVRPGAGPDQKFELFEFRLMIRDRV